MPRHLISIDDLSDDDLTAIVERGAQFAAGAAAPAAALAGQVAGVHFRATSTRTRTAFTAAALRLGAGVVTFGPADLQTNTGETAADTGRVLAGMIDVLVARTCGSTEELRDWASWQTMSVVNAMTAAEHPTQALADLTTLRAHFGALAGLRVLYVGEGNNTAAALALAMARVPGAQVHFRTPPGYGVAPNAIAAAKAGAARRGGRITEEHHMRDLPADVDAVYTTRWETTGTAKPDPDWRAVFAPFQVTAALWEHSPKAVFLHDLPAHRGHEVTAEVLDGPDSLAFEQARNKLRSAMAVLEWCRA